MIFKLRKQYATLARSWLNRARKIDKEINDLVNLAQHTRNRLTSITQSLDGIIVSGSHDPHKFDSLVELENSVNQKIDEFIAIKTEIFRLLSCLPDRNQRLALIAYYLDMKTWEQVAVDMHYSYDNIMRIRKCGLLEVEKMLQEQKTT